MYNYDDGNMDVKPDKIVEGDSYDNAKKKRNSNLYGLCNDDDVDTSCIGQCK